MRWFKHMTASSDDEKLSRLKDAYGLEGYGFWWSVVEIVADKVGEVRQTSAEFSPKKWGNLVGISPKKFRILAEFCANLQLFSVAFSENLIKIDMPNILKFRDEYTERQHKKSGQNRDKLPPLLTDTEADTDTEEDHTTLGSLENEGHARARDDSQGVYTDEPGIEFAELRTFYDEHSRAEAPLAGFFEYKQLRASRRWPGISRLCDAIILHENADPEGWKSFCPGLVKFLREHWWEKKPTANARASPPAKSWQEREHEANMKAFMEATG